MAASSGLRWRLRTLRNALVLRNWQYGRLLATLNVLPAGFSATSQGLYVHALGITIPSEYASLVLRLGDAKWLNQHRGVTFRNCDEGVVATAGKLTFRITTGEEIFVLREILCDGVYDFGLPQSDIVVWDIGMNVGFASLYFASRQDVRAVLGYEPFRPTLEAAQRNIALNPEIAAKITVSNFGIAARPGSAEAEFDPEWKGGVGVAGISDRVRESIHVSGKNSRTEHVELLAADEVLKSIRSQYPGSRLVAKIDCEGSEYEIIRCLYEKQLLRELSTLMIEWHDRGPQELETMLHRSGFATFSSAPSGNAVGMVYAVAQG